jgi:hypothetical protein
MPDRFNNRLREQLNAGADDEQRISVQPLAPWARFPVCPKCGYSLGAGYWLTAVWRLTKGECAQRMQFCVGGMDSQMSIPGFNIEKMEPAVAQVPTLCFGIFHEHLHMQCGRCSYRWLMAVKGEK